MHPRTEDLWVGVKGDRRSAAVLHGALAFERRCRLAPDERLAPKFFVPGHLDGESVRERIDHGQAHPMKPAGGLVHLSAEFAAGKERRQNDFQGRFVLELGMQVYGDAAAVVGNGDGLVKGEVDVDAAGVSGHRLVHGVVEDFGRQVVKGALVGSANVHAGAAAHRLQALQDLDVLGRVGLSLAGRFRGGAGGRPACGGLPNRLLFCRLLELRGFGGGRRLFAVFPGRLLGHFFPRRLALGLGLSGSPYPRLFEKIACHGPASAFKGTHPNKACPRTASMIK